MRATLALLLALPLAAAARAETMAITGAKAWTMTADRPVDNATIVIRDGRVVSIVPAGPVPAGARRIDADGAVVTPGLVSATTRIGLSEIGDDAEANDEKVTTGPLGPAFDIAYAIDANAETVTQARADGVSRAAVFPAGSASAPFAGLGALLHLKAGANILERGRLAELAIVGAPTVAAAGGSRAAQWQLLRNALDEARSFAQHPPSLSPRDQLLSRINLRALLPLVAGRMPLAIDADRESDIRQAIALARDEHVRVVLLGGAEAWRCATALAAAHIPVILDPMIDMPFNYDEIGARADNAALLDRAGVTIAFSVSGQGVYLSYNTGPALREGAGLAVAAGLPYATALRAITLNPARIWGVADHAGTIAPGGDGDLVIWDGDPLEPASAPKTVIIGGEPVSLATRQSMLRDRYAPGRQGGPPPALR